MKPFDPAAVCPKCDMQVCAGGSHWNRVPLRNGEIVPCGDPSRSLPPRIDEWQERITRTCQRCGYSWHEAPLDAKVAGLPAQKTTVMGMDPPPVVRSTEESPDAH